MTFRSLALMLVGLVACGDNLKPSVDASEGFVEAMPGSNVIPQVLNSGGPVLASPIVQPIFFSLGSDTPTTQPYIESYLQALAPSQYWETVGSEYGVGALTIMPSIVSTDPVPTTDADLRTYLNAQLDGTHAGWPAADVTSTIYMVQLPYLAPFTAGNEGACSAFAGYHDEAAPSASVTGFSYAVIANCGAVAPYTDLDLVTEAISHELIEASTDPKVETAPAFESVSDLYLAWSIEGGSEVGDMCEWTAADRQYDVGSYLVQRVWSNKAALAGHDPCVPALDAPYFNAAPELGDLSVSTRGGSVSVQGITVPLNGSTDVTFDLYSDAPITTDWEVAPVDAATLFEAGAKSSFEFQFGRMSSGNNGQQITVSVLRKVAATSHGNVIFVEARPVDDDTQVPAYWWIFAQ